MAGPPASEFPYFGLAELLASVAALVIAGTVAVRSRELFRPNYRFGFGLLFRRPPEIDKRVGKRPTDAIFVTRVDGGDLDMLGLPIQIENNSRRKLSDVIIAIELPVAFHVSESEQLASLDKILKAFPEKAGYVEAARRGLANREVHEHSGLAFLRYNVGSLAPGQHLGFVELLKVPRNRKIAFSDPRYEGRLFSRVLAILETASDWLALCRVRVAVFADLIPKRTFQINVCATNGPTDGEDFPGMSSYVDALWLGKFPGGKRYYRPPLPFLNQIAPGPTVETPVMTVRIAEEIEVAEPFDGRVAVAWRPDPFSSEMQFATLYLPGYDVYGLPARINNPNTALRTIGFQKGEPHPLRRLLWVALAVWPRSIRKALGWRVRPRRRRKR